MNSGEFNDLALSLPGTLRHPHFDRIAFKVEGKRIFATLHEGSGSANIILSLPEQKLFCQMEEAISPVPNKWGSRGWTTFELKKLEQGVILEALKSAYDDVLKKKRGK